MAGRKTTSAANAATKKSSRSPAKKTAKSPAKKAMKTAAKTTAKAAKKTVKAAAKTTAKAAKKPAATPARTPVKRAALAKSTQAVRVDSLMTGNCHVCQPHDNLAAAASGMWRADCGSLPVVDETHHLCGWITDRDISMALGMQPVRAADLQVSQVMNGPVHTCRQDDDVTVAMAMMAEKRVRRVAIVDANDKLVGVLSVADLVRSATARKSATGPAMTQVLETLRAIGQPYKTAPAVDPAADTAGSR